jgi:hypothetical protein
MTTYITRRTLSPLQSGSRLAFSTDSYESETAIGDKVANSDRVFIGNNGFMDATLIGSRTHATVSQLAIATLGGVVSTADEDQTRTYQILKEYGNGKRIKALVGADLIYEQRIKGERVIPIHSGVGTFGIQYSQQPSAPQEKRTRRWPREWHGDNMND